jgi:hypothetical protein
VSGIEVVLKLYLKQLVPERETMNNKKGIMNNEEKKG